MNLQQAEYSNENTTRILKVSGEISSHLYLLPHIIELFIQQPEGVHVSFIVVVVYKGMWRILSE